jgi:hypothetical protein
MDRNLAGFLRWGSFLSVAIIAAGSIAGGGTDLSAPPPGWGEDPGLAVAFAGILGLLAVSVGRVAVCAVAFARGREWWMAGLAVATIVAVGAGVVVGIR